MASKYRGSEEEEWQVKGLCRFHRLKSGMPERPVPYAEDRPVSRCHIRTPKDELFGRFSKVSSNCPNIRGPRKDNIHLPECQLSLYMMPFGLKNAEATYQRMMTSMFRDKIGRMVEVYIDNMVVKSK